jgi:hypothetical protein
MVLSLIEDPDERRSECPYNFNSGLGKPNENWRDLISTGSILPQVVQSILRGQLQVD